VNATIKSSKRNFTLGVVAVLFLLSATPLQNDINRQVRFYIIDELDTLVIELPFWGTIGDLAPELRKLEHVIELRVAEHSLILKREPDRPWPRFVADIFGALIRLGYLTAPQANELIEEIERKFGRKAGHIRYLNKAGEPFIWFLRCFHF